MNSNKSGMGLFTDLYELTMAASYFAEGFFAPATFSLFIREYPHDRGYFISAGLQNVIEFLENFTFDRNDLEYLESQKLFSDDFLEYLTGLRFTGDVYAIEEGRLFFKDEPIIEVTAPVIESQIVETFIINAINVEVSLATKASRCVQAAEGRNLVDFSSRRTQGIDAGLKAARASYIAGFGATSNVMAGKIYGIPISGTMAHSYVTSFDDEIEAFRAFFRAFPDNTVLLIDTYDTVSGARKAVEVAKEAASEGCRIKGVRLDSGDMAQLSKEVRKIFDDAGFQDVQIFASGGFDEYKIEKILDRGAQIDAFGIGTKMGVSADAPYTDIAYKLVYYDDRPVLKLSSGKKTLVGEKQVFRQIENGMFVRDIIGLRGENLPGKRMLQHVMEKGQPLSRKDSIEEIKERSRRELKCLDGSYKLLHDPAVFPVKLSDGLKRLQEETITAVKKRELIQQKTFS